MAGKKKRAAIKELKKKRRDRAVDKDGRPLSKKRARQEEDEPDEPEEPDELVGLQSADGAFYLVDAAAERVYDSARDVYDRLVAAGRWDASARELVRSSDGARVPLGSAPAAAPLPAPAPAPTAQPVAAEPVSRERAGPRLSKAARRREKKETKAAEAAAAAAPTTSAPPAKKKRRR